MDIHRICTTYAQVKHMGDIVLISALCKILTPVTLPYIVYILQEYYYNMLNIFLYYGVT